MRSILMFVFILIINVQLLAQTPQPNKQIDSKTPVNSKPQTTQTAPKTQTKAPPPNKPLFASSFLQSKDKYSNGQLKEKGDTVNGLKEGEWIID